jgi:hypothetical protein
MQKSNLYILGAGASIGANRYPKNRFGQNMQMPSGKNFFYDVLQLEKPNKSGLDFINILDEMYESLSKIIIQAWKLNPEKEFYEKEQWRGVNIEDVFTFLEIGEKLYNKNSGYKRAFKRGRDSLIDFIFLAIAMRTIGQRCLYLEKLFSNIDEIDNIISFNWDPIAETTLEYLNKTHYQNYLQLFKDSKIQIKKYSKKGLILKLHGSVNWMICKNKNCTKYNKKQLIFGALDNKLSSLSMSDFNKCKYCGNRLEVNIVPPSSNKISIHKDSFIHKQWLLAREKIKFIKKVIFIGYSFPPTDFYAEWLFRQINFLIDDKNKSINIDIDIVNPEIFNKNSLTYERYHTIFKGHNLQYFMDLKSYIREVKGDQPFLT